MDIIRCDKKLSIPESDLQLGDRIEIPLRFESDCPINIVEVHKASCSFLIRDAALFIFDDPVGRYPMNASGSNNGSYWQSDLRWWIETEFVDALPDWLKENIYNIGIPSVSEIFGFVNPSIGYEPDHDMEVCLSPSFFKGISGDFWLRNVFCHDGGNKEFAKCCFSSSCSYFYVTSDWADNVNNVVPEFWYQFKKRRK